MDITELAKKACNRTRNANQWLAEGVPEKAWEELNDLGIMLGLNLERKKPDNKIDTIKPEAVAEGEPENVEDEKRSTEDAGTKQARLAQSPERKEPIGPTEQVSQ